MVLKYFTFVPDDACLANTRPGSPHPFFSMIVSASPSPDACTNCIGSLNSSTHRRSSSAPVQDKRDRPEAEAESNAGAIVKVEPVDNATEQTPNCDQTVVDEDRARPSVLAFWRRMSSKKGRSQSRLSRTKQADQLTRKPSRNI